MTTMKKVLIQLPVSMKAKLDSLKADGYTASGFIRALLEREFANQPKPTKEGVGK